MVDKHVISMNYDSMRTLISAAQSVVIGNYNLTDLSELDPQSYAMLYMSQADKINFNISLFAYDKPRYRAVHSSFKTLSTRVDTELSGANVNTLPVNAGTNDMRAFIYAYDIPDIIKWLKPCPKTSVIHMTFITDYSNKDNNTITLSCHATGRSSKQIQSHTMKHVNMGEWIKPFRTPFNHGRSAYINVSSGSPLHEFSAIEMTGRDAALIGELFGSCYVTLVPFSKRRMCYVRSENKDCSVELVLSTYARVRGVSPDDDTI